MTSRWDNRFEITLSGDQNGIIEALGHHGWCQVIEDANISGHFAMLKKIPFKARLALPVIRHLDGGLSIPHFTGVGVATRYAVSGELEAKFRPDADWICELIA